MTQEQFNMMAAMLAADVRERPPTPGCPSGFSAWHTAQRLMDEEELAGDETAVHRTGGQLQRKGLAVHRTVLGVTRWTLTEDGRRAVRGQLARLDKTETREKVPA